MMLRESYWAGGYSGHAAKTAASDQGPEPEDNWPTVTSSRNADPSKPIPVVAGAAERPDMPIYLTGIGTVSAFNTVQIKARIDGQARPDTFTHLSNLVDFRKSPAHISNMTALTKKAATTRRTNGGGERAVVYRGIKILPVPGKRSPTAKAVRDALRLESKSIRGDIPRA